jgi:hypothetical protein
LTTRVDVLAITESWLTIDHGDTDLKAMCPIGYSAIHSPRVINKSGKRRGGGLAVLFKESIKYQRLSELPKLLSFEHLDVQFSIRSQHIRLIVIYRPPDSSFPTFLDEFALLLEGMSSTRRKLIILGDFNLHIDSSCNVAGQRFLALIESFGMVQRVSGATHKRGHTLDLIITRLCDDMVSNIVVGDLISDHNVVSCKLNIKRPLLPTKKVRFRQLKSIDLDSFKADLLTLPLITNPEDSLDELVQQYNDGLAVVLDKHAPWKEKTIVLRPLAPWMTDEIRGSRRVLRKAERVWRCSGLTVHLEIYNQLKMDMVALLKSTKASFLLAKVSECGSNQKPLYQLVYSLMGRPKQLSLPKHTSSSDLAVTFNEFFSSKISKLREGLDILADGLPPDSPPPPECLFSTLHSEADLINGFLLVTTAMVCDIIRVSPAKSCPLDPIPTSILKKVLSALAPSIAKIANLSISSGQFPDTMKRGLITPLLKDDSLDRDVLANYRPVSGLSFLSKTLERLVLSQLNDHIAAFDLISPCQSAYRAHHSTETALLSVVDDHLRAIDGGCGNALLLLDLSAAFDTIDHATLVDRLSVSFGIRGMALNWFRSYLSGRKQCVAINGDCSPDVVLTTGVPQGSVLGPVLFTTYVNPVRTLATPFGVKMHQFSDDTQEYLSFPILPDFLGQVNALTALANCASSTTDWFTRNKVKPNSSKNLLLYTSSPHAATKIAPIPLALDNTIIPPSDSVKNLGVILDSSLSMVAQIGRVCKIGFFQLRTIGKIRKFLTTSAAKCLVNALVLSHVDYANSLLVNLPEKLIARLQRLQNAAAKLVVGARKFDHAKPIISRLMLNGTGLLCLSNKQFITTKTSWLTYERQIF